MRRRRGPETMSPANRDRASIDSSGWALPIGHQNQPAAFDKVHWLQRCSPGIRVSRAGGCPPSPISSYGTSGSIEILWQATVELPNRDSGRNVISTEAHWQLRLRCYSSPALFRSVDVSWRLPQVPVRPTHIRCRAPADLGAASAPDRFAVFDGLSDWCELNSRAGLWRNFC